MDMQDDNVNVIMAMGYTRHQAQVALKSQNGLEAAIEWLLEKGVNEKDYVFEEDNNIYKDFIAPDAVVRNPKQEVARVDHLRGSNDELKSSGEREGTLILSSSSFSIFYANAHFLTFLEAAKIRKELSVVQDDIKAHDMLTQSLKQRSKPYLQQYKQMQERISMWSYFINLFFMYFVLFSIYF
jgi:hypothetical protein